MIEPHVETSQEERRKTLRAKQTRLDRMMGTYASPKHLVVGAGIENDQHWFAKSGLLLAEVSPERTLFEIGSITKVFAGILLCVLVEEGTVDPQAPLRHMSDDLANIPDWITPERLTTHTSGLPNFFMPMWQAMLQSWPDGPYAAFRRSDLLAWMDRLNATAPRRRRHAYSNLGVGLLGEAMAMHAGQPFVELLADRVLAPLALHDTTTHLTSDQKRRFAKPKRPSGKPAPPWKFDALAAAGCLRASARDLAQFSTQVMAALDGPKSLLDRAICRSAKPLFGLGRRGATEPAAQCSGWLSMRPGSSGPRFLFHNGGTAGSSCALYICADQGEACLVLSNNGLAGSLWGGTKLSWSDQIGQAQRYFEAEG